MTSVQPAIPPVTIMSGGNIFLRKRAVESLKQTALKMWPDADVISLDADSCDSYTFEESVSPSLLATSAIVLLNHIENAKEDLSAALLRFCKEAVADSSIRSTVICQHAGGNKNRQLITGLTKAGANQQKIGDLKSSDSQLSFVYSEFKQLGRSIEPQAAQALVSVLGNRADELSAMCEQLCFDFDDNPIPMNILDKYLTGNPESNGFRVSDLALDGKGSQSVLAMRQAVEQGVDVVAMVGAMAYKIRLLAKIAAMDAGKISMQEVGVPSWQIKSAKRQLRGWTSEGISAVLESLALADAQSKGESGDPVYALERAILLIARKGRKG